MVMNPSPFSRLTGPSATALYCRLALVALTSLGSITPAVAATLEEFKCGILNPQGQYGPFDYRTATSEQKFLVESAHFSKENELLIKGTSQVRPGPDIDYTLRAFPNHARALKSMMELHFREKTDPPPFMRYTVDCWFNRAFRFAPDDPQVRLVYGIYLMRSGQKKAAVEQLEMARAGGLGSANFQYNLGLAYFQAQEYEKARAQAYKAKEMGYELQGLKNLLTKAGQWREPPPSPPKAPDESTEKAPESAAQDTIPPKN
jgi:tetratricopeptide (TPR) repeat protein